VLPEESSSVSAETDVSARENSVQFDSELRRRIVGSWNDGLRSVHGELVNLTKKISHE